MIVLARNGGTDSWTYRRTDVQKNKWTHRHRVDRQMTKYSFGGINKKRGLDKRAEK